MKRLLHQQQLPWDCKLPKSWHFPLDDKVALEAQWGCSLCQARVRGCWEAEVHLKCSRSEQAAPQSFLPHSVETSDCHRRRQQLSWDCRVVTPIVANSNCGCRANTKFASRIVLRDNITTFLFTLKKLKFHVFCLDIYHCCVLCHWFQICSSINSVYIILCWVPPVSSCQKSLCKGRQ